VAVAFFTDEEGSRFAPDMLGSLAYVGGLPVDEARRIVGIDGAVLCDELQRIGYEGRAPCPGPAPAAFVELHIEQGPVLEEAGVTIGAVTGVQGISWTEVVIEGQPNHAGTTPLRLRHDAGYAAAALAVAVRRIATELGGAQVGTVGRLGIEPGLVNVVGGRATLTVDLRNTDADLLAEARRRVRAELDRIAAEEGVRVSTRQLADFDPVAFDPGMVDRVERTAEALGHSTMRLPSGAGPDAQMLARVCPAGMIFVPSQGGISHNPAEHTDPADIEAGADVLFHVVCELAGT
jgi:N-carbamoyl-L-amino-acid hydrolase